MAYNSEKDIINFPGSKWHSANKARLARQAQSIARKGVTYANYLKSAGEIIQKADSSTGTPIGDILIVTGFRFDEESWDDPLPRVVKAVTLQIESGTLTYDPTERLEFPDTQAIRRFDRINKKILPAFLQPYNQVEQTIRQMQSWGFSPEKIQKALKPAAPESEIIQIETSVSAIKLLKAAFTATIRGRIF